MAFAFHRNPLSSCSYRQTHHCQRIFAGPVRALPTRRIFYSFILVICNQTYGIRLQCKTTSILAIIMMNEPAASITSDHHLTPASIRKHLWRCQIYGLDACVYGIWQLRAFELSLRYDPFKGILIGDRYWTHSFESSTFLKRVSARWCNARPTADVAVIGLDQRAHVLSSFIKFMILCKLLKPCSMQAHKLVLSRYI